MPGSEVYVGEVAFPRRRTLKQRVVHEHGFGRGVVGSG
jgi:hypothetical protein